MKVSVIVPVYNVEPFIRQCAESLFSQTWRDIQYIFVDDGSPDRSVSIIEEVLESFPERKSQVTILHQDNAGLPQARMTGLRKAVGDYIIHVDSDDWVEPDYVETLSSEALKSGADMVYCDFYKEYGKKPAKVYLEGDPASPDGKDAMSAMHNSVIRAYMWNKLERRSLYDLDNLFVPVRGYHEDIVFQSQTLFNARTCVHVRKPLYHYRRRRSGALTGGKVIRNRRASALNMLEMYKALPKDSGPLTVCAADILMRAGWYCCATLDFKLLASCPDVVKFLAEKKDIPHNRVTVGKQRYTKLCCRLMRLF